MNRHPKIPNLQAFDIIKTKSPVGQIGLGFDNVICSSTLLEPHTSLPEDLCASNANQDPVDPPAVSPPSVAAEIETAEKHVSWHARHIKKGHFGGLSKIREELEEAEDALEQDQMVMLLIELSDIVGAAAGVAERYFSMSVDDLARFAKKRSAIAKAEIAEASQ